MYAPMIECVPKIIRFRTTRNIWDDPGGCMPNSLRALVFWFPKSAEWEVLETRDTTGFSFSSGQDYKATLVYIKVRYPSIADGSGLGDRFDSIDGSLRETIFSFGLRQGLIVTANHVGEGDVKYPNELGSTTGKSPASSGAGGAAGSREAASQTGTGSAKQPTNGVSKPTYPISSGSRVMTRFGIRNQTFRQIQVFLDGSDTPIVVRVNYQGQLEVGSTHIIKVVVGNQTFQARFTVPRVMRDIRVTTGGIEIQ
jgi:hypothetical protein